MKQAFARQVTLTLTTPEQLWGYAEDRTGIVIIQQSAASRVTISPSQSNLTDLQGIILTALTPMFLTQKMGHGPLVSRPAWGVLAAGGSETITIIEMFG